MKKNPPIIFIAGISCSGKSTVYKYFKKNKKVFPSFDVRDIDEDGVPPAGRYYWKRFRMELLLSEALKNKKKGKGAVICGITIPFEVISSELYSPKENIHFVILTISEKEFNRRMKARLKTLKEEWRWESVKESNKKLAPILLNQAASLKNSHVINTEKLDEKEMIEKIKEILINL